MADVLDNGKYMLENLPGEVMRKAMETTNKLSQKGSFYYGTGGYETVTIGGNSYQIYQTTAMNPPTGSDGIYYLSINKNGSDQNLAWKAPKDISVQNATNATNATNYTKEGGGTESIEQGIANAEAKVTELEDNLETNVHNGYYAQHLSGAESTLWGFKSSNVFTGGPVSGDAEAVQAMRVNSYIKDVSISEIFEESGSGSITSKVLAAKQADLATSAEGYASGGAIDGKFKEIGSRLDSLGFRTATITYASAGANFIVANSAKVYQEGKFVYGMFQIPQSVPSTSSVANTRINLFTAVGVNQFPSGEQTIFSVTKGSGGGNAFSLKLAGSGSTLVAFILVESGGYWTNYWFNFNQVPVIRFCYRTDAQDGGDWFFGQLPSYREYS